MVPECFECRIERPGRLSGYRPAGWCAVCGRTESQQPVKRCSREECTNVCHVGCLGEEEVFACGNTGQLRALAVINDPVIPYIPKTQANPDLSSQVNPATHNSTDPVEEDLDNDLNDLRKEELVRRVRRIRKDFTGVKSQLSNYRSVSEDLVDKRQILVEALSVVDTLLAIRSSEGRLQCSVACSVKPYKINGEAEPDNSSEYDRSPPDSSQFPSILPSTPDNSHIPSTSTSPLPPTPNPTTPTSFVPPSFPLTPSPALPSTPNTTIQPSQILPSSPPPPSPSPPSTPCTTIPPTSVPPSSPPASVPSTSTPPFIQSHPPSPSTTLTAPTPTSIHPPHPAPLAPSRLTCTQVQQVPLPREDNNASLGGTSNHQRKKRRRKQAPRGAAAVGGAPVTRQQPRQEASLPRQHQAWCSQCRRQGHTRDQCPKEACDYCQGRNHSSQTCYIRIADQRQKELVEAVRHSGQETLVALRTVAWQLHQPSHPRQAAPTVTAPHGAPVPQWPHLPPVYPGNYGAGPHLYRASPPGWQQ